MLWRQRLTEQVKRIPEIARTARCFGRAAGLEFVTIMTTDRPRRTRLASKPQEMSAEPPESSPAAKPKRTSRKAAQAEAAAPQVLPEAIIEIRDPQVDVPAIMAEIRAGLASRGYTEADYAPDLPVFGQDGGRWVDQLGVDSEWAYVLEQLDTGGRQLGVAVDARPSPVPVAGGVLSRLRRAAHELSTYYVNMLAGQQRALNELGLRSIARLAADQTAMRAEQRRLRAEIAALRARLEANDR